MSQSVIVSHQQFVLIKQLVLLHKPIELLHPHKQLNQFVYEIFLEIFIEFQDQFELSSLLQNVFVVNRNKTQTEPVERNTLVGQDSQLNLECLAPRLSARANLSKFV